MSVIAMLAAAQFVMVLDTTVMNVSISQVVADLDTTVLGLQGAITIYTLVMASLMLLGGKLSDRWGARRAFAIGLLVYGAGSLTTALAPSLPVLLVGWSLVEGVGAALVIPAIAALIIRTYEGQQRALAYGILGAVSGASAAVGPLIGGWVTTVASWRVVFAGETVLVIVIVLMLRLIPRTSPRASALDVRGVVLSVADLGIGVFAILRSSQWGWILPGSQLPEINGRQIAPLHLSPTIWLLLVSGVLLGVLYQHEERVKRSGGEPLIDFALLRILPLRAGLIMLGAQQFITLATFFVLPLYLQTVLGFDALRTGTTILPLSVALFVFALGGAALSRRVRPRQIVRLGLVLMLVGELVALAFVRPELGGVGFGTGLAFIGAGLGLLASQLGNVIMSAAPPGRGGEAGGLQGTAQNLGASLGTALIGSVLIGVLASRFGTIIGGQEELPADLRLAASQAVAENANFLTAEDVRAATDAAGLSPAEVDSVVAAYSEAQLNALRGALAFIAVFAVGALAYLRGLIHSVSSYASEHHEGETDEAPTPPASPEPHA